MSEEYCRYAIDFVDVRGRPLLAMEGMSDFLASDNTRTGLGEIDFGLGKPVYAGVAKSTDLISFYVRSTNKEERNLGASMLAIIVHGNFPTRAQEDDWLI
ncbi:hypothetical protein ACLB2K_031041 [Fragaria x ananassa]